jgi:hypothetical protein
MSARVFRVIKSTMFFKCGVHLVATIKISGVLFPVLMIKQWRRNYIASHMREMKSAAREFGE